ncbi:MAG: hypothetical protein Q9224_000504, partial [Gallowayella concinna]
MLTPIFTADGKWGLNGIPAGVVFALDLHISRGSTSEHHQAGGQVDVTGNEIVIPIDPARVTNPRSARGSLVKRKWTDMQHKLMKRKTSKKRPAQLQLSVSGTGSHPSPTHFNEQSPRTSNHDTGLQTPTRAQAYPYSPRLHIGSLPLPSPSTQYAVRSLHDDDTDEEEIRVETDRHEEIAGHASWTFPTRQSSLSVPPTIPQRRHSRDLRLFTNTVAHDVEKTEEERQEDDHGKLPFAQHIRKEISALSHRLTNRASEILIDTSTGCPASAWDPEGRQEHDRPKSADSDISPRDTSHGVMRLEKSMAPTFKDFVAVPGRPHSKSPQTATIEYGRDSFMTDNISSLGSGMQSSFFPSFPSHVKDDNTHSRRPSHATDTSSYVEEANDDADSRRSSTMFTLTPATPLQFDDARSRTVASMDAWTDSFCFSPDAVLFSPE